jgi:hypothetical protein
MKNMPHYLIRTATIDTAAATTGEMMKSKKRILMMMIGPHIPHEIQQLSYRSSTGRSHNNSRTTTAEQKHKKQIILVEKEQNRERKKERSLEHRNDENADQKKMKNL